MRWILTVLVWIGRKVTFQAAPEAEEPPTLLLEQPVQGRIQQEGSSGLKLKATFTIVASGADFTLPPLNDDDQFAGV